MSNPSNADQIAFWNGEAGEKWVKSQDRLDKMLAGISDEIVKTARAAPGEAILDIGCGCGETSLRLAKTAGRVVGIDISRPMLARAAQRAKDAGIANFKAIEADASDHSFGAEFDLLFSRFGVMFFADPDRAFANLRKSLKPGGRLAFVCWRDWRDNEWARVPIAAARPHLPPQPPMGPEDPGPFAFADLARLRRILSSGGFDEITARPFDTQMHLGADHEEALAHTQEFGPVARMMAAASDAEKAKAVAALSAALKPFADRKPFTLGGAVWIVTARI
ncbi:MAG: class I SAM-dependent methyltransferase [Alphaproteobacteria bacterium]|nr:class I SAM-dependent methyltransferase [Alphaproteobacteria bacterium]